VGNGPFGIAGDGRYQMFIARGDARMFLVLAPSDVVTLGSMPSRARP
jgi:hypothetical protein